MVLLLAGIPRDIIRSFGRWKSNAMLSYLHASTKELIQGYSNTIIQGGHYTIVSQPKLPSQQPSSYG